MSLQLSKESWTVALVIAVLVSASVTYAVTYPSAYHAGDAAGASCAYNRGYKNGEFYEDEAILIPQGTTLTLQPGANATFPAPGIGASEFSLVFVGVQNVSLAKEGDFWVSPIGHNMTDVTARMYVTLSSYPQPIYFDSGFRTSGHLVNGSFETDFNTALLVEPILVVQASPNNTVPVKVFIFAVSFALSRPATVFGTSNGC